MRWFLPLVVSASTVWAQFPLPIPTQPASFPLQRPSIPNGEVVKMGSGWIASVPAELTEVVQVAAGARHSLALKSDGTVVAWVSMDLFGESSVPEGLAGVVQVAAGADYSLALKSDGTVVAWGISGSGLTSVPAGLTGVVQVAAGVLFSNNGERHSLALKSDGTVVAWGSNESGQTSVPAGLAGVVQVAAGMNHSLVLKSDGTVVAWGSNESGQTSVPAGLTGVVQVAAGGVHSLALKSDGTVVAWGSNIAGTTSVPLGLGGVVKVAAGADYSLALKSDGTVVAWGGNASGQSSVPAGLAGVVQVAAGAFYSLLLKSDTDGDGLTDQAEVNTHGTDPSKADTDGDGLSDGAEVNTHGTDPSKADTDGDGLPDFTEIAGYVLVSGGPWTWNEARVDAIARGGRLAVFPTQESWQFFANSSPNLPAAGGWIGLSDEIVEGQWKWVDGSSLTFEVWQPNEPNNDGNEDYVMWTSDSLRRWNDAGGGTKLGNYALEFFGLGTDPKKADSDGDGMGDGWEVANGFNPKDAADAAQDTDGDGLTNLQEHGLGTDPKKADSDGDGMGDGVEVNTHKTDPKKADTDGDGLDDRAEVNTHKTNPRKADTDEDGYDDRFEILQLKSDPLGANNAPSFVLVGDPRNPDEDNAGFDLENAGIGYVGEDYEISTTEVTCLMYARFLNAVAKTDFLYGLYNTFMGPDGGGGIVRNGTSGNYTYSVTAGFESRPVNFVSLYDALRYINWLHNGMPNTGLQDSSTTENGAYKLLAANPRNVIRNPGAKYFLPDQDEWHKAAFFDPNPGQGRPTDSYWLHADQTMSGPGGNFASSRINHVATSAGPSHYGTYDQGGNVWEWTETVLPDGKRLVAEGKRPMVAALTTRETADLGFRVGKSLPIAAGDPLVVPDLTRISEEFNLGDDTNGLIGAVAYEFNIGTYEVSNAQYAVFLNALAKTDSFYGLYNTRMGTDLQGGIMRSGQNGNFVYTVKPGFANKPVNFVTIYSAMRFCNWLHNGARTDSETERGAYRLLGNIPSNLLVLRRSPSARFYLPTQDEWYKAAFYDPSPTGMPTASYWSYAVKADIANAQQINFGGAYAGLTDVSLPGAGSYFGTFGQSGNAAEWTETISSSKLERLVWGGHYSSSSAGVSSQGKMEMDPRVQVATVGFRVAADKALQRIAPFASIGPKSVGSAPFEITVPKATSGLPVKLSVKSGPASLSGGKVTITGQGTVVLAANQDGSEDFDPAPEVTTSFTVTSGADRTQPTLRVTMPSRGAISTRAAQLQIEGTATDNISPTRVQFRIKPPKGTYTPWTTVNLAPGKSPTKSWTRLVSLDRKGEWLVQIRALDARNNASQVSTVTITRR